jgi:hypothetical protein
VLQVQCLFEAVEQTLPTAEDERRDRDRDLVNISGAKCLTDHVRAPSDGYVLAACRLTRPGYRLVVRRARTWSLVSRS